MTSDSTDQSLSAAQGKILKTLVDGKAPISHTHTKSQITDFPTSMPASDVYAWAKAATKPSYTKAEVGLGNVDNTADKDKNVKYATTAGNGVGASKVITNKESGYIRFNNGIQICWGSENCSSKNTTVVFAVPFINNKYAVTITGDYDNFGGTYWTTRSHKETQFNINGSKSSLDIRDVNWIAIGQWFNSN